MTTTVTQILTTQMNQCTKHHLNIMLLVAQLDQIGKVTMIQDTTRISQSIMSPMMISTLLQLSHTDQSPVLLSQFTSTPKRDLPLPNHPDPNIMMTVHLMMATM